MKGVGAPGQLPPEGASSHGYAMAKARVLWRADTLVWDRPALSPWLETSAPDAPKLLLMQDSEMTTLSFREGAHFDGYDHGDENHEADGHGGHEHEEYGEPANHVDHAGHGHVGMMDPDIWCDPQNAIAI